MSILKYLFPVPKEDSKRILTFANHDDFISFRHHTYKKVSYSAKRCLNVKTFVTAVEVFFWIK